MAASIKGLVTSAVAAIKAALLFVVRRVSLTSELLLTLARKKVARFRAFIQKSTLTFKLSFAVTEDSISGDFLLSLSARVPRTNAIEGIEENLTGQV
jgi:hypothetical protein